MRTTRAEDARRADGGGDADGRHGRRVQRDAVQHAVQLVQRVHLRVERRVPQDAQQQLEPEELQCAQLRRYLLVGVQPTKETAQRSHDAVQVVVLRLRLRLLQGNVHSLHTCNVQCSTNYCSRVQSSA